MGWIQPQLIPPTKQKKERTHSHNQTSEELESFLKHGLEPFQPTSPATKHTVTRVQNSGWRGEGQGEPRPRADRRTGRRISFSPRKGLFSYQFYKKKIQILRYIEFYGTYMEY